MRVSRAVAIISMAFVLAQSACSAPVATSEQNDASINQQSILIPVTDAAGHVTDLQGRVCRPAGDAPARLVVINHGSPPDASSRPLMKLGRCNGEAALWFLDRGYVVVFALRRGYGATGGDFAEDYGRCDQANYVGAGIETARDINAIVNYATTLPFVRPDGAVVVGQSAGGWGTIAYDSLPHPKVAAFVVMAGGRGGHQHDRPNTNCHPDLLAAAAGHYGATATTPMLLVYAANDSFFGQDIARALYAAFTQVGGHADFEQPGPYDGDGHKLFFGTGGSAIWGPMVDRYLTHQLGSDKGSA